MFGPGVERRARRTVATIPLGGVRRGSLKAGHTLLNMKANLPLGKTNVGA